MRTVIKNSKGDVEKIIDIEEETLLDKFARSAMQQMIDPREYIDCVALATGAYEIAESMIAEKKRREG